MFKLTMFELIQYQQATIFSNNRGREYRQSILLRNPHHLDSWVSLQQLIYTWPPDQLTYCCQSPADSPRPLANNCARPPRYSDNIVRPSVCHPQQRAQWALSAHTTDGLAQTMRRSAPGVFINRRLERLGISFNEDENESSASVCLSSTSLDLRKTIDVFFSEFPAIVFRPWRVWGFPWT